VGTGKGRQETLGVATGCTFKPVDENQKTIQQGEDVSSGTCHAGGKTCSSGSDHNKLVLVLPDSLLKKPANMYGYLFPIPLR